MGCLICLFIELILFSTIFCQIMHIFPLFNGSGADLLTQITLVPFLDYLIPVVTHCRAQQKSHKVQGG